MGLRNCWTKCRSDFDLNGVNEIYFLKSEWETFDPCEKKVHPISTIFLLYRLIFAIYFVTTLFTSIICTETSVLSLWPIYMTHWSYLIQTIYAILAFALVLGGKFEEGHPPRWGQGQDEFVGHSSSPSDQLPFLTKSTWILFNVVNALPVFVSLVYWIGVYDGESKNTCEAVSDILLHGANTLLALSDAFIVAIPVRFIHSLFGFVVLAIYLVFTILYEIAGGSYEGERDYIYKVINWRQSPLSAGMFAILGLIGILISHSVFAWSVTKWRIKIANRFASQYTRL